MTDEELGRAWAAKHGKQPFPNPRKPGWCCWTTDHFGNSGDLVDALAKVGDDCGYWSRGYESESAAYAALGAALRRIAGHIAT